MAIVVTNYVKRVFYFAYYIRRLDRKLLRKFMDYVQAKNGWSRWRQWREVIRDSMKYNISILEYYQFRFFELDEKRKSTWAGTGTMYEFQRRANPLGKRHVFSDKRRFYQVFGEYFRHKMYTIEQLDSDKDLVKCLLSENSRIVLKDAMGNCGAGVSFEDSSKFSANQLLKHMKVNGFDLVETFLEQHPRMHALSPSGVNTVRVFTQIRSNGEFEILGARLRITVNSPVDNLAAGNLAAPIDITSGLVSGPAVYSDITRPPESNHPVTGVAIVGFEIPYWDELLNMVQKASLRCPENRSIGWDVVITEGGPGLIEGNHDWCKLVWQLPVNKGLIKLLDRNL